MMPEQIKKPEKLGDIIRELNKRHEAFLIAIGEDVHMNAHKEKGLYKQSQTIFKRR